MKPTIELSKPRDFGELINDTFAFVKQNFKPLIKSFFAICGFFLVASAIFSCLQQIQTVHMLNSANGYGTETVTVFSRFRYLGINYVLAMVFVVLTYVTMEVTVLSYIALYKEKSNVPPTVTEVWGYVKYFFIRSLGTWIVKTLLFLVGLIFCVVPGIWLYPIFALILPVMIFENASFGFAFNHGFRLIEDHWWVTFGVLVITVIIVYVGAIVLVLPVSLANMISVLVNIKHGMHFSVVLSIATIIFQHLAYALYIIPTIASALCYFNLTEIKEGTGILNRIQHFGKDDLPAADAPEEQY